MSKKPKKERVYKGINVSNGALLYYGALLIYLIHKLITLGWALWDTIRYMLEN